MQNKDLKKIPKIEKILLDSTFCNLNKDIVKAIAKDLIEKLRQNLKSGAPQNKLREESDLDSATFLQDLIKAVHLEYIKQTSSTLKPVINATGVVLQTNLGRSIFDKKLLDEIIPLLSHYNNLEYDLINGKRGERYSHTSNLLCSIFGVEDALIVNNNAAAVFLILNTFAKNKEVIISRGELIEIGGSFRIPEIMNNAGGILKEVGATNKTKISDYKNAISADSAVIMKAHKSNFDIVGFVQEVSMQEISSICKENNLIDYYDLGSGYVRGVECGEPSLEEITKNPPSLISFSGDKLFGATQAGIILGKKVLINKLKQNHLLRALRVDKITLLILQATLKRYIENRLDEIPTLKMLSISKEILQNRAQNLLDKIPSFFNPNIIEIDSLAGGGSLPNVKFASIGISLFVKDVKVKKLEVALRQNNLIARILNNKIILDLRTLQDDEMDKIIEILNHIKKSL